MIKQSIILGIWILAGMAAGFALPGRGDAQDKTITLAGTEEGKNAADRRWAELIYAEAFRRLGYRLEVQNYPVARSSLLADEGKVDGDIHRAYDYLEAHPDLIRVVEPHFSIRFVAFAARPGIRVEGWESLRNTNFHVEYRRGVKKAEIELTRMVGPARLSNISTVELGLKKLLTKHIDLYIDVEDTVWQIFKELKNRGIDTTGIYEAGIMETTSAHLFLHKRHADLAPKIATVLKEMKQEGLIEEYRKKAEAGP